MPELTTRDKVKRHPPRKNRGRGGEADVRWWKLDGPDLAQSVFVVVKAIEDAQRTRRELFARYAGLYLDVKTARAGDAGTLLSRLLPVSYKAKRVTYNAVQSVVDTAGAHTSKQRPRPIYLTSGSDLKLQMQARKLTRFMDGLFATLKAHVTGQAVARDSRIFGTGIGYFYADPEEGEIKIERVLVDELRVDDDESRNGSPRQIHRVRLMSRDELIDIYPEFEEQILAAQPAKDTKQSADLVEVIDSWHLPTGKVTYKQKKGGGDDRGKPVTDGYTARTLGGELELEKQPYTKKYFPFLPLHWNEPLAGWWGRGLAEELVGKQIEINNLYADISAAQKRAGSSVIFVEEGSAVDDISDERVQVVKYRGSVPQVGMIPAVSPEIYQHLSQLKKDCYEETGVPQSMATGMKPAGVDAAVAIREVNDLGGVRFILKSQAYEQWYLDAARICIDLARDLYDGIYDGKKIDLKVKGRAGKFIESIKWSEVNLEDDAYDMQVFPVSLLPTTPQGRMQTISEMLDKQLIAPDQAKRLLEFPDLEEFNSLENAMFDYAAGLVSDILEGGDYEMPDPRAPLQMVKDVALANYLRALRMKVPEYVLDNLRQLMDDCQTYLDALAQGVDLTNAKQFNEWISGTWQAANTNAAPVVQAPQIDPATGAPIQDPAAMQPPIDQAIAV